MELSALESLKIPHILAMGKMVSPLFLGCFLSNPLNKACRYLEHALKLG